MDETKTDDPDAFHFPEWAEEVGRQVRLKNAGQEFVNEMIDCVFKIQAFEGCPDKSKLYEIVRVAVRLAHTCFKQEGKGTVRGFGVKDAFIKVVRERTAETDLKEIRADVNRRKRIKALREENKELKRRLKELEG